MAVFNSTQEISKRTFRQWLPRLGGSNTLESQALKASTAIPGWLTKEEAREIFRTAASLPPAPICCEIGSWLGKSSVIIATAIQPAGGTLYCVDPFDLLEGEPWAAQTLRAQMPGRAESRKTLFLEMMTRFGVSTSVKVLQGYSSDVAGEFNAPLDFVLIDGDHSYDAVLRDFALWSQFLKPGGVLAFHDFHRHQSAHDGPRLVVERWIRNDPRWRDQRVVGSLYLTVKSQVGIERQALAAASATDVPGWLAENEVRELFSLVADLPQSSPVCCEIGTWLGKSSIVLGRALQGKGAGTLYCVDPFDIVADEPWHRAMFREHVSDPSASRKAVFLENMRRHNVAEFVRPLEGYSFDVAETFTEPLDFLFIDGDHSYDAVLRDFALWSQSLKVGGVLAFHDYHAEESTHDGPRRVVNQWIRQDSRWTNQHTVGTLYVATKSHPNIELPAAAAAAAAAVPGWLSEAEVRELFSGVANLPVSAPVCCEIGSWLGKSSVVLGTALRTKGAGTLYCVDPFDLVADDPWDQTTFREHVNAATPSRKAVFLDNMRRYKVDEFVQLREGFSYDVARQFAEPLDFLFIDGDHQYLSVLDDFRQFGRLLKPGGVIAFHDYHAFEHQHDGPRLLVHNDLGHHFGWTNQRVTDTLYVAVRTTRGAEIEKAAMAAAESIPGWLTPDERRELFNLAASLPADNPVVCEVGSWLGKSAAILGTALREKPGGKLYCVDLFDLAEDIEFYHESFQEQVGTGPAPRLDIFNRNMRQHGLGEIVIPLAGRSENIAPNFGQELDLLFIDGDHTYEGVKQDFTLWSRWLKPNGLLVFHDVHPKGHPQNGPRLLVAESLVDNPDWIHQRLVDSLYIARKQYAV